MAETSARVAAAPAAPVARRGRGSFAALRHPAFRGYALATMVAHLADNIEHVITYWVLWQTFHSPMLAGYAVIAHWTPSLLLSVHLGQLAERYDCRRVIQAGQVVYYAVQLTWAYLILTGSLQVWHAVILLAGHGLAGSIGAPAGQLIIHDIVGPRELPSAVRISSTLRQLVILFGPAVGGVLMLAVGPGMGMIVNTLLFVPLSLWLLAFPYTGHGRDAERVSRGSGLRFMEAFHVLREVSGNRPIIAMVALSGASSLLVGNAFQAQMPEFAQDLGADGAGFGYSMLLGANAAGAFFGGVLLEVTGFMRPTVRAAMISAAVFCVFIVGFAVAPAYWLAFGMMFVAGIFNLAFMSMSQALVQILAPPDLRGRVVGLYNMASMGLRVGSGVTVGVMGAIIGIHWALGLSALALLLVTLLLLVLTWNSQSTPSRGLAADSARG